MYSYGNVVEVVPLLQSVMLQSVVESSWLKYPEKDISFIVRTISDWLMMDEKLVNWMTGYGT